MLVISRKEGQKIRISEDIVITVLGSRGRTVRLGLECPIDIPIIREELLIEKTTDEPLGVKRVLAAH